MGLRISRNHPKRTKLSKPQRKGIVMRRGNGIAWIGFLCCLLSGPSVWAEESVQALTSQAMEECQKGRRAKDADSRGVHFDRGRVLAENAVALDTQSADAQFSLFCNRYFRPCCRRDLTGERCGYKLSAHDFRYSAGPAGFRRPGAVGNRS